MAGGIDLNGAILDESAERNVTRLTHLTSQSLGRRPLNNSATVGFFNRIINENWRIWRIDSNIFVCTIFAYRKVFSTDPRAPRLDKAEPRFGVDLLRLTRRCRGIDKYVSSRAQLTIDDVHCLSVLFSDHPASVKRLSELANVSSTRASKILKDLEQRGYVSRTPDAVDRRKERVLLTETGSLKVQRILSFYAEIGSELMTSWRPELAQDFSWLLETINQAR